MTTTVKQKLRGRWISVPYSNLIKDYCRAYLQEGTFTYDYISKYFVGDQRICPPKLNVNVNSLVSNLKLKLKKYFLLVTATNKLDAKFNFGFSRSYADWGIRNSFYN